MQFEVGTEARNVQNLHRPFFESGRVEVALDELDRPRLFVGAWALDREEWPNVVLVREGDLWPDMVRSEVERSREVPAELTAARRSPAASSALAM